MAYLTSRISASGVSLNDLIHIVKPDDLTQNPAGSSYKIAIGNYTVYFQILTLVTHLTLVRMI
jgi:hypothetical protein